MKGSEFSKEEKAHIQKSLSTRLGPEWLSYRAAAGGRKVAYLEGWKSITLANETFGFDGWSSCVKNIQTDHQIFNNGKYDVGVTAIVRVELKDGTFHEDVGYGICEGLKSLSLSLEKAKKEAVTDGLKRALRSFGHGLGNCLYDKTYLSTLQKLNKRTVNNNDLTLKGIAPSLPKTSSEVMPELTPDLEIISEEMAMALKLAEYNVLQRPLVTHSHSAAPSPPLTAASEEGRLQSGRKESANHNDTVARRTKSRRLSRRERAEGEIITSSINTIVSSSSGGCLPSRPLRPASRVAAVNTTKLLHEPGFLKNTKIEIDMAALTGYNSCLAALL